MAMREDYLLASSKGRQLLATGTRKQQRRVKDMEAVMLRIEGRKLNQIARYMRESRGTTVNRIRRGAPYVAKALRSVNPVSYPANTTAKGTLASEE